MSITRDNKPGMHRISVSHSSYREEYVTLTPVEHEDVPSLINRAKEILSPDCSVVKWDIFGSCELSSSVEQSMESAFSPYTWPVSWMEGGPCGSNGIAGMAIYGVSGIPVEPISINDKPVGRIIVTPDAAYCFLGGILPSDPHAPHEDQTQSVLEQIEEALGYAGMSWEHVVRTWYYNDAICVWYNDFNRVRTAYYSRHNVGSGILPASTGIGAENPGHAALQVQVMAVCSRGEHVQMEKVISPLQCPASDYGSSFSRACEIKEQDVRRLLISGTASVGQEGDTLHTGDVDAQITHTADVVKAILDSRGMSLEDTVRGVAYFKDASDGDRMKVFYDYTGLDSLPVIITSSEICRNDLLFEIELDCIHV